MQPTFHERDAMLMGDSFPFMIIAGANKGLGYELCKTLLKDKHPVIIAARSQQKGAQ